MEYCRTSHVPLPGDQISERRRSATILTALGATPRQLGGFLWVETVAIIGAGLTAGAVSGWALTHMLVKVLTGVFDPPPDALAVPWSYLGGVGALIVATVGAAGALTLRTLRRPAPDELRDV